jgi:ribosomal protein S18 acetylase RimI-like enzyme
VGLVVVRSREPGDESFLEALSDEAFGSYAVEPARAVRAMMAEPSARTIVAELDERPVGFVVVTVRRRPRAFGPIASPAVAHLDAIAVTAAARGRGIGRELLELAEAHAVAQGAQSLFLMTAARNRRARKLFEAAGFKNLAAIGDAYAYGDRAVMMMKLLVTTPR